MTEHEINKNYKTLSREERETVISWDAETERWHLYTDEPKHARKYEKYIDDDRPTRRGYNVNGGALSMLEGDLKGVTVTIAKKRQLTPEQKKRIAELGRKKLHELHQNKANQRHENEMNLNRA